MPIDILKVFTAATLTFFIGIGITPIFTHYAYKYSWWKKTAIRGGALGGGPTPESDKIYGNRKEETKTPRMGGVIIWGSVLITMIVVWILAQVIPGYVVEKLNFVSRNQTWLPIFTLIIGALFGLLNDILDIKASTQKGAKELSRWQIVGIVTAMGVIGGWWFFSKLEVHSISFPIIGLIDIGWLIIPLFVLFMLGIYSGGVIDGIDGLSGGVFASILSAYSIIAFFQGQIDIATFCAALVGGILAYLWFNIPPARFWMTETGTMALTTTITVVAFLTDQIFPLIIIAFPLIATSASVVLQVFWKKFFGKKIFRITPLHHHFEALGWPSYKVTMRYWVLSVIFATIGTVIALI